MSKRVSTRFYLTKCDPDMEEESVKKYIYKYFPYVSDAYVRKLPMKHDYYSSFIFFTNTNEEVDLENFRQHRWPGVIKFFFAPRDRYRGY